MCKTRTKKWYEKALEKEEKSGAMDHAAKCCITLGNLCLAKVVGKQKDFNSAKKWFRKALDTTTGRQIDSG